MQLMSSSIQKNTSKSRKKIIKMMYAIAKCLSFLPQSLTVARKKNLHSYIYMYFRKDIGKTCERIRLVSIPNIKIAKIKRRRLKGSY